MVEMAKGVRDFAPEDKIIRDEMVHKLVSIFQRYGYSPLETPSIERLDTLTAKFAAGTESDASKEIFKLTDQGQRELGLRFDLTVPFSRFIALNPTIKMPFKRYEIGRVFRDGPIKLGRYREFWQCDVDVAGISSPKAEAELILLSLDAFKELGLDAYIEVNNRKLLFGIMDYCDIDNALHETVIVSVDKIAKQGMTAVMKELSDKGLTPEQVKKIIDIFSIEGSHEDILGFLKDKLTNQMSVEGLKELEELFSYLGFIEPVRVRLNISLARGLGYYTGIVFEGFLKESQMKSSICGGGRYDNMIGMFAANNRQYPAVGISFGMEPILDGMKLAGLEQKKSVTQLFIIPIKTFKESIVIATQLREAGVNVDIDLMERGVSKNLDYANSMKIPYVAFIGDSEISEGKIKLKNMHSGKEELIEIGKVLERVRNN